MTERIVFPPGPVAPLTPARIQILALSGGGYRGLFGACVLANFEAQHRKPIADAFQLLAGTSIGGIIACALAVGVPAERVRDAFIEHGRRIFQHRLFPPVWLRALYATRYSGAPLERIIADILGPHAQTPLAAIEKPLLLPTVSVSGAGPRLLRSGRRQQTLGDVTLAQAALATAAAPTYFPSRTLGKDTVVDGGLIANAPDLVALTETLRHLGPLERTYMLSIGTCGEPLAKPPGGTIRAGLLEWLLRHNLVELTLAAQERLAVETLQTLLQSRFVRIDAQPSGDEQRHLALDKAGAAATSTLQALAGRALQNLPNTDRQKLDDFFRQERGR